MTVNRAGEKWGGRDVENVTVMWRVRSAFQRSRK